MTDLHQLLGRVRTLTDDRKHELADKHAAGTLTQEEKDELATHIVGAMAEAEIDIAAAKALLDSSAT